jgi:3-deoxy-7-phosphoheptulonate synthase
MNSGKNQDNQIPVWKDAVVRRVGGERTIRGLMAESFLCDGNQPAGPKGSLQYGVSVTDPCIGWSKTEELIEWTYLQGA